MNINFNRFYKFEQNPIVQITIIPLIDMIFYYKYVDIYKQSKEEITKSNLSIKKPNKTDKESCKNT